MTDDGTRDSSRPDLPLPDLPSDPPSAGEETADAAEVAETAGTEARAESNAGVPDEWDDTPTGEVITGPIDPSRHRPAPPSDPASKPPTREMEPFTTGTFGTSGGFAAHASHPQIPVAQSAPNVPVARTAPAGDKRGRRRTIALVSAAIVLLVVIAGVGSELYMRNKVTSCIENAFSSLTGTTTDVSVSRRPMLFAVFGSEVPWVQVDTNDSANVSMKLHARAEGISTDGGTAKSLNGDGYLPLSRITELSNEREGSSQATITSISADESAGTIKIHTKIPVAILQIPATVTLKPVVDAGGVKFEVKDATALTFGLPSDFAQPIVDQVSSAMFGPLFKQIQVSELKVTGQGVDFAFKGSDVNLKAASEGQLQGSGNCSI